MDSTPTSEQVLATLFMDGIQVAVGFAIIGGPEVESEFRPKDGRPIRHLPVNGQLTIKTDKSDVLSITEFMECSGAVPGPHYHFRVVPGSDTQKL